ncbi:MAG TPA: acyltransferase [Nakamurella sp.]|nr:acyltransferase [Nakamurella sp.]
MLAANSPLRGRYPLDALRAIAAVGVLAFHAYQNNRFTGTDTYPWTGLPHELMLSSDALVDLFFVISGFVLWLPVARAALDGRPQRPGRVLLLRRAARLVPLYLVVVLVVWLISNPQMSAAYWNDLLLHLTFTQVYSDHYIFWTVGPAWTLAVEFHFYLLIAVTVPLLAWWIRRSTNRRARMAGALALPAVMTAAGVAWLTWAIHLSPQPGDAWAVWFGPLAKAPIFALGLFLAVLVAAGRRLEKRKQRATLSGGAAAVILAGTLLRSSLPGQTSQWLDLAFGLAAAAFVATIVMTDGPPLRWLNWKPLVRLGILSYSIYLLHEPVMRLARYAGILPEPGSSWGVPATFAVVLVATVALAMVTYPMIEQYGMKLLDMFGPDGRRKSYYDHGIDEARPARRPTMRIAWVPDGELTDANHEKG